MNNFPLVSVAILSYKNLQYINECIDSILKQSYSNIELIISDDSTPEFDCKAIEEYIDFNNSGNIKNVVINTMLENVGTTKNFNYVTRIATGKYLKVIAADDLFYENNSLELMVQEAERKSANVLVARSVNYDMYLEYYIRKYPNDEHWNILVNSNQKELFGYMSQYSLISSPAVLYNRIFLLKEGGVDEKYRLLEDWPLWLKMIRKNYKFTFFNKSVVIYRSGGVSNGEYNNGYAEYQIEHADVIKNECLPYKEYMASEKQYRIAKKSEREHRLIGERILNKKGFFVIKITNAMLIMKEKISAKFFKKKRWLLFSSFVEFTVFMYINPCRVINVLMEDTKPICVEQRIVEFVFCVVIIKLIFAILIYLYIIPKKTMRFLSDSMH